MLTIHEKFDKDDVALFTGTQEATDAGKRMCSVGYKGYSVHPAKYICSDGPHESVYIVLLVPLGIGTRTKMMTEDQLTRLM